MRPKSTKQMNEAFSSGLKIGDRVFSKYDTHVSHNVEGRGPEHRHVHVQIKEGDEFIVTDFMTANDRSYVFLEAADVEESAEFYVSEERMITDFGKGTWKEFKRRWIKSLKEAEDFMDWEDVKIGETYTKIDTVMPMIGHAKDWSTTFKTVDEPRVVMPVGTEVVVTDIVWEKTQAGMEIPYVEFKTKDGKQYFLADDAFCIDFFNGSMREWNMKFFQGLKEDGKFKNNITFKQGDVRMVSKSNALSATIKGGKNIWFRVGNKLIVSNDLGDRIAFTTNQRKERMYVDKKDFLDNTVWEKDYVSRPKPAKVTEEGQFMKRLARGQQVMAKKNFAAEVDGVDVTVQNRAKIRFVREMEGRVIFKTEGRRFRGSFLSADTREFYSSIHVPVDEVVAIRPGVATNLIKVGSRVKTVYGEEGVVKMIDDSMDGGMGGFWVQVDGTTYEYPYSRSEVQLIE